MRVVRIAAHKRAWEEFAGVGDPFWAVLADPKLKYGAWDADEFFASGGREVEAFMRRAAELGRPARHHRALDFGCGVGRVTRALGERFDEVLGVDISENMLANARELNARHPNCSFELNVTDDLQAWESESFDLVHTRIVLQHQPSREAIEGYLAELLRVVRDDGLVVFQLPSSLSLAVRVQPRVNAYRLLRRLGLTPSFLYWRLGLHPASMRHIPVERVETFVESIGGRVLATEREWQPKYHFESALYYAASGAAAQDGLAATLASVADVHGWISDAQARRLYECARAVQPPGPIVEIGSYQGRSTIVLARGARDGVGVVAIDPHAGTDRGAGEIRGYEEEARRDLELFERNLMRCGVGDVVRHVRLPSAAALSRLDGEFELVFVDGAHRYLPARADIAGYGARVRPGGVMVLHDAFSAVGVTLAQLRLLVFGSRFRYERRTASLVEYRREDLRGAARLANAARQLAELPWFARNIALKLALKLKLRPIARLFGDRTGEWPA